MHIITNQQNQSLKKKIMLCLKEMKRQEITAVLIN